MADIRTPDEADRQSMIDLSRISFNVPPAWVRYVGPAVRLDRFLCAYEKGRMVAMAQAWDLSQWFGGRALKMAGISAVAAVPERRDAGLAPEVVRALLRRCRERGAILSTLYPSRSAVYRRLGYEFGGILAQYRMPIADLPATRAEGVEEMPDGELDGVRACYRRFASRQSGLVDCDDEDWWRLRVIRRWNPDVPSRAAVVRGAGGIEGYVALQLEALPDTWGCRLLCSHLIGSSAEGLTSILGYLRSFRGIGQWLVWYGPPHEPLSLLAGGGGETIQSVRTVRWMMRLLDVPAALQSRGYPDVTGATTIAVKDELFPDNEGSFRIEAEGGRVTVRKVEGPGGSAIPIGALSALFTGYASAEDLVRVGLIQNDERSIPFLSRLFSGPTPWTTDFF